MQLSDIREYEWLGVPEREEKRYCLCAGNLQVEFCTGRLINFSCDGYTVLTEVYFALRDQNWNTIPFTLEKLKVSDEGDHFAIEFHAVHKEREISYEWDGRINGTEDSTISYEFRGTAGSDFLRNRIGFCVLHPADCCGKSCQIVHSDGSTEYCSFPEMIAPHQPFLDIRKMSCETEEGMLLNTEFEGEVFETEDQRNWTDASFKTYCTPLGLPFPVKVHRGDCVYQKVIVSLKTVERKPFSLGSVIREPLTAKQIRLVEGLKLSCLRYEYYFSGNHEWFDEIVGQAERLNLKIRLAVFFTEAWEAELKHLAYLADRYKKNLCEILIFEEYVKVVREEILRASRSCLKSLGIPVGSGTDAFFTQNNREPLPAEQMDFVSYSNNPQVHAFDNDSIMATANGQMANVLSCKRLFRKLPILVSPVTMKIRWNPDLTTKEICRPGVMPGNIDIRQMSLFAAAWFVRSLAALLEAGAYGADYFELTGPAGIMQEEMLPDYPYPSVPGMIYPVYYAMRLAPMAACSKVQTTLRETYAAIYMEYGKGRARILVANSKAYEIDVPLLGNLEKARMFSLNLQNVKAYAAGCPESLEETAFEEVRCTEKIPLMPYEVKAIDFQNGGKE